MLGEDAYRTMVRETEGHEDSYVLSSSQLGRFNLPGDQTRRQLRGIRLDPERLESTLGIDIGTWIEPPDD